MEELLARRQNVERIIRNAHSFANNEAFQRQLIIMVRNRLLHLDNAWQIFNDVNIALTQQITERNDQAEIDQLNTHFDEIEELFVTAQAILRNRILEVDQGDVDPESSDSDNEQAFPNAENNQQDNGQINIANNRPLNSNNDQQQQPLNNVRAGDDQFGMLIERICQGMANKKDNTWGTYDGELSKWQGFHDNFVVAVHNDQMITPSTKLQLLQSSLRGEALAKFGQWPVGDNNYQEAWEWLQQQNRREYQASKEILYNLIGFRKIERASGFLIERLCTVAEGVMRQLRAMKYPVNHYDLFLVHIIQDKLDAETSKDWEIQRTSERPTFQEIIAFLQLRGRALSSRQSSERKIQQDTRKRYSNDNRHDEKRFKPNTSSEHNSGEKPNHKSKQIDCKFCSDGPHGPRKCLTFGAMNIKTRKIKVREHNLCFNCLRPNHTVRDCTASNCQICGQKHHTLLCTEKQTNQTVNHVRSQHKKPKPKKKIQQQRFTPA